MAMIQSHHLIDNLQQMWGACKMIQETEVMMNHWNMTYTIRARFITGVTLFAEVDKYLLDSGLQPTSEAMAIKWLTDRITLGECPQVSEGVTQSVHHLGGPVTKMVVAGPDLNQLVLVGGPETGAIRSSPHHTLTCILTEDTPVTAPMSSDPLDWKMETTTYFKEKVAVSEEGDSNPIYTRVWRHSSVPQGAVAGLFLDVLQEFPLVRIYPAYAAYFWMAKRMHLI